MTITGPSKSICVMSTWSGTPFVTTAFSSSRMSSMLIVGSLGLRPATGRFRSSGVVGLCQLHRRFSLLDVRLGELRVALLRDRDAVDALAGRHVPLHRRVDSPDSEVDGGGDRDVVTVVVLEDPIDIRAPRARRNELVGDRAAREIERVEGGARPIDAADQELDVVREEPTAREDVRGKRRARLDGHRGVPLELVQLDFRGDVPGEDLEVPNEARGREAEVIVELVDFLPALVGD